MMEDSDDLVRSRKLFLSALMVLLFMGFVAVFSSSYIYANEIYKNSYHYTIRQFLYISIGLILMAIVSKTKFSFWIKNSYYINIAIFILIALTLVPGIRAGVKGAYRWLNFGFFKLQPAELIKITLPLLSLYFFEYFDQLLPKERLKYILSMLLPLTLIVVQPDFGTFSIGFMLLVFTCFISHFKRLYFYLFATTGGVLAIAIMLMQPYRVARLLSYLDPWKNAKTSGFQIIQSYLAFANGGLFGVGLGNSNEKLFYLPEAHNDFILSVIGEETGFLGLLILVSTFVYMLHHGLKLSFYLEDRFRRLAVRTYIFGLSLQIVLNMGVVLGLLPTKGLNLPFISYGGSSMFTNLIIVGLILSATKESRESGYNY